MKFLPTTLLLLTLSLLLGCGGGSVTPASQMTPPTSPPPTPALTGLTELSADPFTNPSSQHATEVETSALAVGTTIVSAFQVGRTYSGGASDIGFATSTDQGTSWIKGFLPGITLVENGPFGAASDPVVAFDAAHGVWLVSSLAIVSASSNQVLVSQSPDGINWARPVTVSNTPNSDKNWTVCDNTASSPYYGHCYSEWDDPSVNGLIWMSTSTDGGLTWGAAQNTADLAAGIGGQPVVQPNGTVIVPIMDASGTKMLSFSSSDGGNTWSSTTTISDITDHLVAGNMRTSSLPGAQVDQDGKVYVVWQDCRFRAACAANDMVLSTSNDGLRWTRPTRIPIDAVTSTVDHFIPGLAVDPATSGNSAHLALTYYYYTDADCDASTCDLNVGTISSPDGGSTWAPAAMLSGPMLVSWLPNTFAGLMVGDYVATAFFGGKAFPFFAVAEANSGTLFDEPTYTTTKGITATAAVLTSIDERPVAHAHSDHPPRQYYDQEHRYPIIPPRSSAATE